MGTRLKELVDRFGGRLIGDGDVEVACVAALDGATASSITFLSNPKFRAKAASTQAAALILGEADDSSIGTMYAGARIVTGNPYAYFAKVAQHFAAQRARIAQPGVHPSAVVDPSASVAQSAAIGPHVVIGAGARVGEGCVIDAACFIGDGAVIGADTHLFAHVTIQSGCELGRRAIVHSGAVIGADGFGFANEAGAWIKIPQSGRVLIGDDVEIGANTTIDRGALDDTVIEHGVKLDNQIQIGHNCRIGAHTAMAGCVGVAGSAVIGKYCTFGGAAMVLGHLTIADHVHISAGSLVSRSIAEPGSYTGFYPLAKNAEWEKSAAIVRNLGTMREKIRALEKSIKSIAKENNE